MIELPSEPGPDGARPSLMDFGLTVTPPLGGPEQRIERLGNRFRTEVTFPPQPPEKAGVFISRLVQAKSLGLRVPYPLLEAQGLPGAPVVDGADQTGTSLAVRDLTPHYAAKERYWLSIEDADGNHYLHLCTQNVVADATGNAVLSIWPMLRARFADGAKVHLAQPMVQGFPEGDETSWELPLHHQIALQVTIKEAA